MQVPSSVQALFRAAGWKPSDHSSSATVAISNSATNCASAIVARFGGLTVGATGPGREQAASDVQFYSRLRPEVTTVVQPWSSRLGELVAVATAHHDHIIVFVNSAGNLFAFTDLDEQLYSIGQSFGEAMERLLLGISYGAPIARDA
jgi:hypothetical protein